MIRPRTSARQLLELLTDAGPPKDCVLFDIALAGPSVSILFTQRGQRVTISANDARWYAGELLEAAAAADRYAGHAAGKDGA
jgi:hypothetical protein